MRAIHLICKWDEGAAGLKNLRHDKASGTSRSGQWNITEEEARSLKGGWLYLHETKTKPSTTGGTILDYDMVTDATLAHQERVVFTFRPSRQGKGQAWRGRGHAIAHNSGLVDAELSHETSAAT